MKIVILSRFTKAGAMWLQSLDNFQEVDSWEIMEQRASSVEVHLGPEQVRLRSTALAA